jgi:hypothetical protein
MPQYISSNSNRFYAAAETTYGLPAAVTAGNRFPALGLQANQTFEVIKRLDKTGSRTFLGSPNNLRRQSAFEVKTYLTSWNGVGQPPYGPLTYAAMGAPPAISIGLTVAVTQTGKVLQTTTQHNLSIGSAVSTGVELRFVTAVNDASTITVNAAFTDSLAAGTPLVPTVTYCLSNDLPSVTLYDYWDPSDAISRFITGAGVDTFAIDVNGDYHDLTYAGPAADILDNQTFVAGTSGLGAFPQEPGISSFDYSVVPGHLGQVWLGNPESQFFTLTRASIEIKNNLAIRNREFGALIPTSLAPGPRELLSSFTIFAQDSTATTGLYAAAKQRNPVQAMLQLGQQPGQMMGIFLPEVVPEVPIFDDSQTRLLWDFKNNVSQGVSNDEIYIAFA